MSGKASTAKKPTLKDYNALETSFKSLEERVKEAEAKAKESEDKLKDILASRQAPGVYVPGHTSGGDEAKCLAYFGAGTNVKKLLEVDTMAPQFGYVDPRLKAMVIQLKMDFQVARAIGQIFYGDAMDFVGATEDQDRMAVCKGMMESRFFKDVLEPKLKAFGTGVTGGGAEWIPTAIASTYISEVEVERELVQALMQVMMPTSPYELPTNGFSTARRGTENTSATDTSFTTGSLSFSAKKFLEYYIFPEELNEDSAPAIVMLGRQQLTEAHQRAFETSVINGVQSGTTHLDSDTQAGAADLAEKQYHGLRKLAVANSANGATVDFGNAAATDTLLKRMRSKMGKFGANPMDLMWIAGPVGYIQMTNLANVVTVDKMGPNATVLKGQLGSYDGIPIVQSGFMRENLNATGVYDGTTVNRGCTLLINRKRLYFGTRRPIRLAIRPSKSADDRIEMASYSRVDFKAHTQGTKESELTIVYGYNQATSI